MHVIKSGTTDQIAYFRAYLDDGSPKTDLDAATAGLAIVVSRIGLTDVSISSPSNKANPNDAHADGAIYHVSGNLYTIDLPDAAVATPCPSIVIDGSYAGGVIEGEIHPIVAYNPEDAAGLGLTRVDATISSRSNHAAPDLSNLDAPVSSRSSHAAPDLSNLDAAVSSRSSHPAPDLSNLDAPVSSRSSHAAPDLSNLDVPVSTRSSHAAPDLSNLDAPVSSRSSHTPADVDATLTASHGGGSWAGGGGGGLTGPNDVTISVVDDGTGIEIQNALVRLYRTGESGTQLSDGDGEASFGVQSATFTVVISAAGYDGHVAPLAVGGDLTQEYRLTPSVTNPPSDPRLCSIAASVRKANGQPLIGATVQAKVMDENSSIAGSVVSTGFVQYTTDSNGLATLELIRQDQFTSGSGTYLIEVFEKNIRVLSIEVTIPNQATSQLDLVIPS